MPFEENRALARRFNDALRESWRTGSADVFDSLLAPGFVHRVPGVPPDRAGRKQMLPLFRAAFPDLQCTIEDLIAEGDKVVDRVTWRGTHQGELMGIPPAGKATAATEIHVMRIAGGQIAERWGEWDQLGLMQQLGAIPPPGQAPAGGV